MKTPQIRLLNDQCLVRLEEPQRLGLQVLTSEKRLYIPETAQREDYELFVGEVLETGPGRLVTDGPRIGQRNPCEVKPGDRIQFYFSAMGARETPFYALDDSLRVIRERNIQAILNG